MRPEKNGVDMSTPYGAILALQLCKHDILLYFYGLKFESGDCFLSHNFSLTTTSQSSRVFFCDLEAFK